MRHTVQDGTLTVFFEGSLDSGNSAQVEDEVLALLVQYRPSCVVVDADQLYYISSAGLRVILRMRKLCVELSVINASSDIAGICSLTGIDEMVSVHRKLRSVSLKGLQPIGAGAFGTVYRLDAERVMKVYDPQVVPLEKIERERKAARQAFIHGIPSAIPFETVHVGSDYGIIYELIDARTLGEAVVEEPERLEERAVAMAELLRKLHATHFEPGKLPDARLILQGWIDKAEASGLYAASTIEKLRACVDAIPASDTFVHGDFHPANIMVMPDDELMLIDMGDASEGDPLIDLAGMYHVVRVAARRPSGAERLTGMPADMLDRMWDIFVRRYYGVDGASEVADIERRLAFAALPRTMGSTARSRLITDEDRRKQARELEQRFLASYDQR